MWIAIILIIITIGIIIANTAYSSLLKYYNSKIGDIAIINSTSAQILTALSVSLGLNIRIFPKGENLDNYYSPKNKAIFLSNDVYNSKSVPAIAISMHELGHAIQHKKRSKLFTLHKTCSIINKISSIFFIPLIILLIISLITFPEAITLIIVYILLSFWLVNFISRFILIFLERDASKTAMKLMKEYNILDEDELPIAKKLLNKALLTYIGGIFHNIIKFFINLKKLF